MTTIYLIRHGEVDGNFGDRRTYVGWGDKSLTQRGEAQARAVAQRLSGEGLQAVYSSDLTRARRTGECVAEAHGLSVTPDAALREINFGVWEGLTEGEILEGWGDVWRRRQSDPVRVGPPEGENLSQLWARWQPAWRRIVHQHEHQTIALVSHNSALRVLLCHLLDAPLEAYRRIHMSNCGLTRVELAGPQAALPVLVRYINETCHLNGIS